MKQKILKMVLTGMMTALVFIGTRFIQIPTPATGGYINLGDGFVLISGLLLGPIYGSLAAGIGSALADILSGYAAWAFPTFIIKGIMALIVGIFVAKKDNKPFVIYTAISFSVFWAAFNLFLKNMINKNVNLQSVDLAKELEFNSTAVLIEKAEILKSVLLYGSIALPLILVLIIFFLSSANILKFTLPISTAFIISGSIMIVGYYFATYYLYGSAVAAVFGIPGNIAQFILGVFVAHLLLPVVQKIILPKMQS